MRLVLLPAAALLAMIALGTQDAAHRAEGYSFFRTSGGSRISWNLSDNALATVENNRVLYTIGSSGTDHTITTGRYSEFAAMRRAFDIWNTFSQSDWEAEYIGGAPDETMDDDGVNTMFFDKSGSMDSLTLGQTVVTFVGSNIRDGDIRLNDDDYNWDSAQDITTGDLNRAYIENVMIHEIGHFFGLDHSMLGAASMLATSPGGAIAAISPSDDDIAGNGVSYGNGDFTDEFGRVDGHVTKPGGGNAFGVHVALLNIETWELAVGALTGTDGDFSIRGVPPGRYWLIASPVERDELSGNSFWDDVLTDADFQPEVHGVTPGSVGVPDEYLVEADTTLSSNTDFTLTARDTSFFEQAGTPAPATTMAYGEAAIAHITSTVEEDVFSFSATAGDVIDMVVVSDMLRANSDLRLRLIGTNQSTVLNTTNDAQPSSTTTEAWIVDPIEEAYTVDAGQTGTLYLEVSRFSGSATNKWFLITVQHPEADTTPDAAASAITLDVQSLEAGGADTATCTVEVRNKFGDLITDGSITTVTLHNSNTGDTAMTESPANSGKFVATIAAAGSATTDTLTATADGVDLLDSITLRHVGAISGSQSSIKAVPDSLFADGVSTAEVRITAKDSGGRVIHDSTMVVVVNADVGSITTATFDSDTGEWVATFTADSTAGTATISATLDGTAVNSDEEIDMDDDPSPIKAPKAGGSGGGCVAGVGNASVGSVVGAAWLLLICLLVGLRRRP